MKEIILDEKEWAKEAIDSLSLGKSPYETIVRVAKYYKSLGYKKREIRRYVEDFMIRCEPRLSLVRWEDTIMSAVNAAEKFPLICIDGVSITIPEMEKIEALDGVLKQRVMFSLLCLAKYGDSVNKHNCGWVNLPQKDIFTLANVTMTSRRQSLLINDLWSQGYIGYSCLVNNVNLNIKIIKDGPEAMFVSDFRNLGNQYMKYHDTEGRYFECVSCGIILKTQSSSTHQRYCKECAGEIKDCKDETRKYFDRLNRRFLKEAKADSA